MDTLVLNTHQYRPARVGLPDRYCQREYINQLVHAVADLVTISAHGSDGRPVVMCLIQVIPRHFIHTNGKHGLETGINACSDQFCQQKLVDEKCSCVAKIEKQRMAQGFWPLIVRLIVPNHLKQRFVQIKGLVEVGFEFLSFGLAAACIQAECFTDSSLYIH